MALTGFSTADSEITSPQAHRRISLALRHFAQHLQLARLSPFRCDSTSRAMAHQQFHHLRINHQPSGDHLPQRE